MTENTEPSIFRVPETKREALTELLKFTDEQFQQLLNGLNRAYEAEDLFLFEDLIDIDGIGFEEKDSVLDLVRDLSILKENSDMEIKSFSKEFAQSIFEDQEMLSKLTDMQIERINERIGLIVSSEPANVVFKARILSVDDLSNLKDFSVVTDIRPVFDSEGSDIKAFIEVHKLSLVIEEDERLRTDVVSVTNEDLRLMMAAVKRALKKSKTLENTITKEGRKYFKTFGTSELDKE